MNEHACELTDRAHADGQVPLIQSRHFGLDLREILQASNYTVDLRAIC